VFSLHDVKNLYFLWIITTSTQPVNTTSNGIVNYHLIRFWLWKTSISTAVEEMAWKGYFITPENRNYD